MAKISERFSDKFLSVKTLTKDGTDFTISAVDEEAKVGQENKIVIELEGPPGSDVEQLPLNRTNALEIADLHGDETDDWIGKRINVFKDKTMYQGRPVPCIRVREVRK